MPARIHHAGCRCAHSSQQARQNQRAPRRQRASRALHASRRSRTTHPVASDSRPFAPALQPTCCQKRPDATGASVLRPRPYW
ncbi:hypothetical protein DEG02_007215 [Xanthomonas vasicola]|nr:hypothetical protein KWO_014890 [Xanthomonas vasicola pv. musacearum NCPPB 4379]RJL87844.1 hypothetical protein DEG03_000795 [Xanthomonas vasicola]RRJ44682.1 hypothetical protein EIM46_00485 [Xanthomonas vasicola pv. musacearum]RJL90129.1 hypothetical protein DEF98_001085 [Xanthomonas vasicola]RJL91704.1 hypothetical protein DEF95_003200 [Xanthomonas vasicola]